MEKTDENIQLLQDASLVLKTILQYDDVGSTNDRIKGLTRVPLERVLAACAWLCKQGYIYTDKSLYVTSDTGRLYLEEVNHNPKLITEPHYSRWRDEALTGLAEVKSSDSGFIVSEPSDIQRAALPKTQTGNRQQNLDAAYVLDAASAMGVSPAVFRALYHEGRIKMCKGLDGKPHQGQFHRRGKGLQHLCVECRKKQRRAKC